MNDPNGFVYYNGQFHMFYQHYPDAPQWGLMHWGHAVSDDLICWRECSVALTPDAPYDENGCFSGSSIVHGGKLYAFYTGNAADGRQTQCLAISEDGERFAKYPGNPVIGQPPETVKPQQFRDPCVFRHGDWFFMIVGAESTGGRGQAVVYRSNNLTDWTYLHTITAGAEEALGYMWECPGMFFVKDQAVLLLCPQGIAQRPPHHIHQDAGYLVGRFDGETGDYTHGGFHKLDSGFDFYAPQVITGPSGRLLMAAWMSTWDTPAPTSVCQWAGSMILPREVTLRDGLLRFTPAHEIQRHLLPVAAYAGAQCRDLPMLRCDAGRLEVVAENKDFTVRLFCSPDGEEYTAIFFDAQTRSLCLDLNRSGEAARDSRCVTLPQTDTVHLDIYLDRSSVEVYSNDGALVMTARVFPRPGSDGIQCSGGRAFRRVSLWKFAIRP
jgi:beta-fructofuranosidase